jgi:hypothetical protein
MWKDDPQALWKWLGYAVWAGMAALVAFWLLRGSF